MLIKFKRGLAASLPALQAGEPALTTDTKKLYIGTDGTTEGNVAVGDMLKSVYDTNDSGVVDNAEQLNSQSAAYYLDRANFTGADYSTLINPIVGATDLEIVSIATQVITVTGDKTALITTAHKLDVSGTVANDGRYTITGVALFEGNTRITVSEAIADQGAVGTVTAGPLMTLSQAISYNANDIDLETAARISADSALDGRISSLEGSTLDTEDVQGIVGAMATDSASIDFTYNAGAGTLTAIVIDDSITAAKLAADTAGNGLVQNVSGALDVNVDDSTLEVATDVVQVKDLGITAAKLAADSVTAAKINADVAGDGLVQNGTTGALDVNAGDGIEVATDAVTVKLDGASLSKSATGLKVSTVDADTVTVSNLEVDNLKTGVLDTDLATVSTLHDTLPSAKAVKDYVDNEVNGGGTALTDHANATTTHGVTGAIVGTTDAQTLTNKTIDADSNTVSNLEVDNFKAGVVKTVLNGTSDSAILTENAVKTYVDTVAQGLEVHAPARLATTANLAATYNNGTDGLGATLTNSGTQAALVIDGVAVVAGDRIVVKNQTTALQNGIYVVTDIGSGSTNWILTRAGDFDNTPTNEIDPGDFFFIESGSTLANTGWVQIETAPVVVGTDAVNFAQFYGVNQDIAGDALTKVGNILNVNVDNATIEISADTLRIKDAAITEAKIATGAVTADKIGADAVTAAKINADVAGIALVQNGTTGALDVNVDDTTIEVNADALRVKDAAITAAKLGADSVTAEKVNADVAGAALVQNVSGALDVNVDDITIEVNADALRVKDGSITDAKLAANAVTTAKILDGNVTADKLAADSVTAAKINADVAGNGLVPNGTTGALDVNVGNALEIVTDAVNVKFQTSDSVTLSADASGLKADVNVDNDSIKIDTTNNYIYVDVVDGGTF